MYLILAVKQDDMRKNFVRYENGFELRQLHLSVSHNRKAVPSCRNNSANQLFDVFMATLRYFFSATGCIGFMLSILFLATCGSDNPTGVRLELF